MSAYTSHTSDILLNFQKKNIYNFLNAHFMYSCVHTVEQIKNNF